MLRSLAQANNNKKKWRHTDIVKQLPAAMPKVDVVDCLNPAYYTTAVLDVAHLKIATRTLYT